MKRADLKAGEAYYYDVGTGWAEGQYGTGVKAVVVEVADAGRRVLVDVIHTNERPFRRTVPVAHLRGPWGPTNALVQQRIAERRARTAQQDRERADANAAAASVTARAKTLGLQLGNRPRYGDGKTEIVMTAETAAKLLDAMNLARWLVSMDDTEDPAGMAERRSVTLTAIINRAAAVLGETKEN
jgi:hypothetical protein